MKPLVFFGLVIFIFEFSVVRVEDVTTDNHLGKLMFKPEYPGDLIDSKTFKKFIEIVQNDKMNVSIFASTANKWRNGNIKELLTLAINLPTNDVSLQTTSFKIDEGMEFLKTATEEKLSVQFRIKSGKDTIKVQSNNPLGMVESIMYYLMGELNSYADLLNDFLNNFAGMQTIHTKDKAGKDQTVKIYSLEFEFISLKLEGLTPKEAAQIRRAIGYATAMYETSDQPKAIIKILEKHLPDRKLQLVIYDNNFKAEEQIIESKMYHICELMGKTYVVFV